MTNSLAKGRTAHLLHPRDAEALDVLGPTIQLLTLPEDESAPCVMRGTIPPDVFVPLHSHPDPETFLLVSGELEGLVESVDGFRWLRLGPGDVFHVPGGVKHAFRNRSRGSAISVVVSTARMGRFFREVGRPVDPVTATSPPSAETIRHFLETALRYGHWNATPEENARVGISVPPAR